MNRNISNTDNVIDSRDVIARIEELESELTDLMEAVSALRDESGALLYDANDPESLSTQSALLDEALAYLADWKEEYDGELKALKDLQDDAEGYAPDWHHGATLINESYFETYAQELAEDIGSVKQGMEWPYNHIDWEAAADELLGDYTSVDFDGTTFYVR